MLRILLLPQSEITWIGKENLLNSDFSKPLIGPEYEQYVIDQMKEEIMAYYKPIKDLKFETQTTFNSIEEYDRNNLMQL